ncbi:MAG: hypothetical protein V2I54_12820 [Bacteroidales bacterium]|jgi:ABC-type polysaccharide/polyol phosphate export permease|nr:hypothetical protein [Bacteroidales bacterium]
MSLFEFLFTTFSGITFLLIGGSMLGVFIYGPWLTFRLYGRKQTVRKTNIDLMIVLGVIVFIAGILNQIAGMIEALEAMIQGGDISPQLVMAGIVESFRIPVLCAFVLIIALLFWYFNRKKWESLNP